MSPPPGDEPHAQRRVVGGARRASSLHVHLVQGDRRIAAWTLNVSRGGLRVIVEERLEVGARFFVTWDEEGEPREARVVWVMDEPDGQILGLQYLDAHSEFPPPTPSTGS